MDSIRVMMIKLDMLVNNKGWTNWKDFFSLVNSRL